MITSCLYCCIYLKLLWRRAELIQKHGMPLEKKHVTLRWKSNDTLYGGEDEEGDDGVVQTACWLGDAGEDGERVQQVTVREEEIMWLLYLMNTSLILLDSENVDDFTAVWHVSQQVTAGIQGAVSTWSDIVSLKKVCVVLTTWLLSEGCSTSLWGSWWAPDSRGGSVLPPGHISAFWTEWAQQTRCYYNTPFKFT